MATTKKPAATAKRSTKTAAKKTTAKKATAKRSPKAAGKAIKK